MQPQPQHGCRQPERMSWWPRRLHIGTRAIGEQRAWTLVHCGHGRQAAASEHGSRREDEDASTATRYGARDPAIREDGHAKMIVPHVARQDFFEAHSGLWAF